MKKVIYLCLALAGVLTLPSCSNDDDPEISVNQTFNDATGLTLTVNGKPMLGKTANLVREGDAATLTLNSTFDMSAIPGIPEGLAKTIAGPGVIPGSPVTVLNFAISGDASNATFSGSDGNKYCTYNYSGAVTENGMTLNISDLKLKDLTIAGKWAPQPFDINEDWESEEWGTVYSQPIHVVWESTAEFNFLGNIMPVSDVLKLLMSMPILDNMSTRLPDALCNVLQSVTFGNDGNIIASYADLDNGSATPVYMQSPSNMAQYVLEGNGNMLFFLSPQAVIAADSRATMSRSVDINNLFGNVIAQLAPMMSEGVPMHYAMNNNELTVYLGTEILLPLLKTNVVPLLRDQELVAQLVELAKGAEGMETIAPMFPDMIASAADVIEGTSKLEIGMNLKK